MRSSWGGHCAQAWEFIGPVASHSEVPSDSRYVLDIDTPCYMFMDISTLRKGKGEEDVIPLPWMDRNPKTPATFTVNSLGICLFNRWTCDDASLISTTWYILKML